MLHGDQQAAGIIVAQSPKTTAPSYSGPAFASPGSLAATWTTQTYTYACKTEH